jgi:hypothetical protein
MLQNFVILLFDLALYSIIHNKCVTQLCFITLTVQVTSINLMEKGT